MREFGMFYNALINNVTMKEKIKEVLEQTFAYNVENDKVAQEICDLFNVVGGTGIDEDAEEQQENAEIEWQEEQERLARRAGMTSEQILNGDHIGIIF